MTDEDLVRDFEAGVDPPGGFHHAEHIRAAWWYARRFPWPVALERFRASLMRFAAAHGKPDRYHETITTAFMALVAERLDGDAAELDWDAFAARHADLLAWNPSILDRYYRPETLASARARRMFVLPDRVCASAPAIDVGRQQA